MILHLVLLTLVALTVTGQDHIPTTAVTTDLPTASGNATAPPPNLIPPPPSLPKIPNNRSITITNSCPTDIWPALLTTNNTGPYMNGFTSRRKNHFNYGCRSIGRVVFGQGQIAVSMNLQIQDLASRVLVQTF
jgi:hypothetical protein